MASRKPINLLRGWPNPSLLPKEDLAQAAQVVFGDPEISTPALQYGPDPGFQPLRESISKWLSEFQDPSGTGFKGDVERIAITGGASQNLACLLQVYSDPGVTRVWMVAPCYFLACRIFDDAGLKVRAVGEGEEGVDLEALERGLVEAANDDKPIKKTKPWAKMYDHIIYCVPTFSNPSGRTMSLPTRKSLVQLARKHNALIITDDVYDFLQWPISTSTPPPSPDTLTHALLPRLVDIDRTLDPIPSPDSFGNAVSNGSFSKIAGPGMRTGWVDATPKFAYGLSQCGSTRSGGNPSQITAAMISTLLSSGTLSTHITSVLKPAYQKRHSTLLSAIKKHLYPLGATTTESGAVFGGYFVWVELPATIDAEIVTARCKTEEELIVAPGAIFEVAGDESVKFPNSVRLCFAYEEELNLEEGVERLARIVKTELDGGGEGRGAGVKKQDLAQFQ